MNCRGMIELIARKLDGALSDEEVRSLDAHLLQCSACRAELVLQQEIEKSLRIAPAEALSSDFGQRVANLAFRQAHAQEWGRRMGYALPVLANAVVLVLAIIYRGGVAQVLAPFFSSLAASSRSLFEGIGAAMPHVTVHAGGPSPHVMHVLGVWGPVACASAVLIIASSKIFALRRG